MLPSDITQRMYILISLLTCLCPNETEFYRRLIKQKYNFLFNFPFRNTLPVLKIKILLDIAMHSQVWRVIQEPGI